MKKQNLTELIDDGLLEKLFGFCYARTRDSWEAQELCSDIVYALVRAANTGGEVANPYAFLWRVARNVYADFSEARRRRAECEYDGDAEEILPLIPAGESDGADDARLSAVYRRIAFLTRAYREVMISFYLEGMSVRDIAAAQHTSETAVRQRLFSARKKIKNEVEEMNEFFTGATALEKIDYVIWGTGNPFWGDPRNVSRTQFSRHIIWLCRKKAMTAAEIAAELNVPTLYVEEEAEILARGENGKYGLLRRLAGGRYTVNFILLDKAEIGEAHALYAAQLPNISAVIADYIEAHREEYLAFPYLNRKVDMNLILWQQIHTIAGAFCDHVERILAQKYFADVPKTERPFSVYGYVDNGRHYGGGWDGADAQNVCGWSKIHLDNIYAARVKPHFHCGLNVSSEPKIQMALRAVDGLAVDSLTEQEREHAAKAVECGYLYREGDTLYTKLLVSEIKDQSRLYSISLRLSEGYFDGDAEAVAEKIAALIRRTVPAHLTGEWRMANWLANMPVLDGVVEEFIRRGLMIPPEDGIGAEGCWMSVER